MQTNGVVGVGRSKESQSQIVQPKLEVVYKVQRGAWFGCWQNVPLSLSHSFVFLRIYLHRDTVIKPFKSFSQIYWTFVDSVSLHGLFIVNTKLNYHPSILRKMQTFNTSIPSLARNLQNSSWRPRVTWSWTVDTETQKTLCLSRCSQPSPDDRMRQEDSRNGTGDWWWREASIKR